MTVKCAWAPTAATTSPPTYILGSTTSTSQRLLGLCLLRENGENASLCLHSLGECIIGAHDQTHAFVRRVRHIGHIERQLQHSRMIFGRCDGVQDGGDCCARVQVGFAGARLGWLIDLKVFLEFLSLCA